MSISMNLETMRAEVSQFSEKLSKLGRSPKTISSYQTDALSFLDYLTSQGWNPSDLRPDTLVHYQQYLSDHLHERPNTVRRAVIGVRQYFRHLSDIGMMARSPFDDVAIPQRKDGIPQFEVEQIFGILRSVVNQVNDFFSARLAVLMTALAIEGLKATELIAAEWSDVHLDAESPSWSIKGAHTRTIMLDSQTAAILREYRDYYRPFREHPALADATEKAILIAFKGRDSSILIPKMTRHGLKFLLYEVGARFNFDKLNSEILRHAAMMRLMSMGKNPEEIMAHLGLRRMGNVGLHFLALSRAQD